MATIISAGTTIGTALSVTPDTSGNLVLQTQAGANSITVPNSTGTLALTSALPSSSQIAKAWANFAGGTSSPLTINSQFNINQINRNSLGNYTVNFTNTVTANYVVVSSTAVQLGSGVSQWAVGLVTSQNTSGFTIQYIGTNGANFDITTGNFVVFSV